MPWSLVILVGLWVEKIIRDTKKLKNFVVNFVCIAKSAKTIFGLVPFSITPKTFL